jgi:hypothetical protein
MITSGLANGKKPKATKKAPQKEKEEPQVVEILPTDARHELFCKAYIKHRFNATKAYIEVF